MRSTKLKSAIRIDWATSDGRVPPFTHAFRIPHICKAGESHISMNANGLLSSHVITCGTCPCAICASQKPSWRKKRSLICKMKCNERILISHFVPTCYHCFPTNSLHMSRNIPQVACLCHPRHPRLSLLPSSLSLHLHQHCKHHHPLPFHPFIPAPLSQSLITTVSGTITTYHHQWPPANRLLSARPALSA